MSEFFHYVEYEQLTDAELASVFTRAGVWWLEASAEWAAHQAAIAAPSDDGLRYANSLDLFLASPELAWHETIEDRHYGEFVLAEFLEEWFGDAADFGGSEPIDPDPSIIRETWDQLGTGPISPTASEAIVDVIEARGDSAEDVIPAYHLANYLLDAGVGAEPVAGTFRDGHADEWRQELAINPLTSGAEDDVSEHPRPARRQVQLPGRDDTIWTDPVTARVDPGGAVYVELMMPEDAGNAYLITVSALFGQPIVANAIAFPEAPAGAPAADYPTPCAHAQRFETDSNPLFTIATGEIIVPDECGLITVVVSHVDPIRPGTDVEIKAQPLQIIDDFERTRASGWGRAAPDWAWRDGNGRAVPGSVADGAGQLTMGTSMSRAHLTFTASIREVLLIGRFTDCDDPNQFMGLGVHDFMPIFLRSNGLLSSRLGSSMVDDFDMCEPWYLRLASVGEGAKVWQATDPEPEDWMVDISPNEREWILDLFAVRYDGAPIPLVIEALDIDWASG